MADIQISLLYFINHGLQNHFLDQIVPVIYTFADIRVTLALIALVLLISWKLKKEHIRKIALLCIIGFFISSVFIFMFKTFYPSPRPFMALEGIRLAVNDNGFYSFPSGHVSITVMVLSIILMKVNKYRKILFVLAISYLLVLSFVVMYGGVHYPIDVIGGGTIGLVSALFTVHYLDFLADNMNDFLDNPGKSKKFLLDALH